MRKSILAGAAGLALAMAAGPVAAAPISLPNGPLYFQFNNLEQLSPGNQIDSDGDGTPDEGNWGVFNISSVQAGAVAIPNKDIGGGPVIFSDDGPGGTQGQITGIFYGITIVNTTLGPVITVDATGGFIDLYWEDAGDDDIDAAALSGAAGPGIRTAQDQAGDFTDGTFLVRLAFASGIVPDDDNVTIRGTFINTITGSGQADSFADVVDVNGDGVIDENDGLWAGILNTDWFIVHDDPNDGIDTQTRDIRFSNFTNGLPTWNGDQDIVGLRSNDPGRAFVIAEPTTLAMLGGGLLLAGLLSRRQRRKI